MRSIFQAEKYIHCVMGIASVQPWRWQGINNKKERDFWSC